MCILVLLYHVAEDAPVVAGANREEFYQRGGEPPRLLEGSSPGGLRAVAGIDPVAGGTWFGVNSAGVLVAVTNRPKTRPPPQPRSRGLLVRDLLLEEPSATRAAERAARELGQGLFAGCNLLVADPRDAVVLHAGDWLRVQPLPPGIHVLTNRDLNDRTDPRIAFAAAWLGAAPRQPAGAWVRTLQGLCSHDGPEPTAVCFRHETRGTVSSSIVALTRPSERSLYLHAPGPPDRTPYDDYSPLLHELMEPSGLG
jgi:hypothetical protein